MKKKNNVKKSLTVKQLGMSVVLSALLFSASAQEQAENNNQTQNEIIELKKMVLALEQQLEQSNKANDNTLSFEEKYKREMASKPVHLNDVELQGLAIAHDFTSDSDKSLKPIIGKSGSVVFTHGENQASIVCAFMQLCDIALEEGEQVQDLALSDSGRWDYYDAITGKGSNQVTHIIIKPKDVGLNSTMIITTDRRTYHLRLKSHLTQYMPLVQFHYPDTEKRKWEIAQQERKKAEARKQAQLAQQRAIAKTKKEKEEFHTGNLSIKDLNFNYSIRGTAPFKPERVYSMGHQTIIEFPKSIQHGEAPALYVVRGKEQTMVNYRVVDGYRYTVDTLFDEAILVMGVGKKQQKITITKTGR